MSKRKHRQLLTVESGKPWLCTQPALKEIIKKSEVENDFLAQAEEPVDPIETKGEIAVIHIVGSIFRYSNLFTAFGMGVSVEDIDLPPIFSTVLFSFFFIKQHIKQHSILPQI